MNWTYLAFLALIGGPGLIWYARRKFVEPVMDADKMPEMAMWGYFLILVGAWGSLSLVANPSDLFFAVMLVPAILAIIAKIRGYKAKGNKRALPDWAAFGFGNAIVLASIGLGKTFVVEPMQIPSSSMRPGLVVGDFIVINKFAYGLRIPFLNEPVIEINKPQRGDVVVFRYPNDIKVNYIKRLIGVPGDTVEYRNKRVTVNGKPYDSAPLKEYTYRDDSGGSARAAISMLEDMGAKKYETLNEPTRPTLDLGQVKDFENRSACQYDETGFICKVPQGHYLMMGDNRDNSNDGRYWGFVAENQLAGKAFLIWMNWSGWGSLPDFSRVGTTIH